MGEELTESSKKLGRIRQPPSVPFLWEIKPGVPKKDWEPEFPSSVSQLILPKPKLNASVPFQWEEKPGKPLPCFSHQPVELATPIPQAKLISFTSSQGFSYPCINGDDIYDGGDCAYSNGGSEDDNNRESTAQLELREWSFETDESFSYIPSLLANCMVPMEKTSTAVPVQGVSSEGHRDQLETPPSPASETDSVSSYATVCSSLAGAPFLECLFPLAPPKSGFLEKLGSSESITLTPPEPKIEAYGHTNDSGIMLRRRPPTLGELIMMSRRRSYQRKAIQMRKQNLSMEISAKKLCGCFVFGASSKLLEGFHRRRKYFPRLNIS